ncbi:MAG: GntR family transcriptional regulator [Proteobacteria bacterium]|nr:GntR family transcriptional regulator [Pseudomonadota bacterium]
MSVAPQLERDRAYRGLLELILGGRVDPGAPFSERKLASSMEIGRTPVREALRDLARDGILEVQLARGTFVRHLSIEDVQEIYEVRHSLEGLAAFLAAERGPKPELIAYGPKFRDMIDDPQAFDPAETYETGAEFHLEIFRSARNRQMFKMYEPLRLRFRVALGLPRYYDHDRVRESVTEHLAILKAIERGDGQAAQRMICDHLSKGLEVRTRIFNSLAKYAPDARAFDWEHET